MLICIFNKNLKQPFLYAPPLFNAFFIRKLWGEVFDGDGAFSARNNMRVTVVSEGTNNNSYHLRVRSHSLHCIFEKHVLCKMGEPNSLGSPIWSHGLLLCLFCLPLFFSRCFVLRQRHGDASHQSDDCANVFGFLLCLDAAAAFLGIAVIAIQ